MSVNQWERKEEEARAQTNARDISRAVDNRWANDHERKSICFSFSGGARGKVKSSGEW